jgi:hypothetical protein
MGELVSASPNQSFLLRDSGGYAIKVRACEDAPARHTRRMRYPFAEMMAATVRPICRRRIF